MIVNQIENLTKGRYKIYIDEEFAFVLYKGELNLYNIKTDNELKQEHYQEIMEQVLPRRAKIRCMNLLKDKDYTEYQLRKKLREGYYPVLAVENAVEYLKSYGYINDVRYTRRYIEYHISNKSIKRIEADLLNRGIDKHLIYTTMDQMKQEGMKSNENQLICEYMRKKNYCSNTASFQEKQKMFAFLYRKGFSGDEIGKLLDITPNSV